MIEVTDFSAIERMDESIRDLSEHPDVAVHVDNMVHCRREQLLQILENTQDDAVAEAARIVLWRRTKPR